ncbi:alpha-1,4-glucan--maltose-1-phosphate maltosyltransferase [Citricoccus sp. I39-566]|uniref:alpha-1,4-glucan--maltose-1-phosphate maltosyltransferase n=1 Tax=Citricoccus sp. I39-566 TaxID=3073268 RepID=UPI00286D1334|nr:alpha-1,4-glucan--maltose-1-phosphate maltosyltransferase [Citricoccus sp. I39-566]WMY79450.1 alpha-1,4-glucan--maltose-1-phosphate maltosyltransferase [Citricoccus sp. I39-566]
MFSTEVKVGRIPVTGVQPSVQCGAVPAKAVIGEDVPVRATVFREGHDRLGATAVLYGPDGTEVQRVRMSEGAPGLDEYRATLRPGSVGPHTFTVEGWSDPFATWHHAATVKIEAGVDVELMLAEGGALFRKAAADPERSEADRSVLARAVRGLEDSTRDTAERLAAADDPDLAEVLAARPIREFVSASPAYPLDVQRALAGRGAWYEFFPRSEGAVYHPESGTWSSGTFTTAARRLPAVAEMGFDVIYLPPIHPIGRTHRKGPNNTLEAGPQDPGSPWAIGSEEGGHDAIHPELGSAEDFAGFVARAEELGLEVALDLALQCSPDHPWVTEHPEWFTTQVDGTIAYAENPPKKYQDIYPLNFDNDPRGLRRAVLKVVELWIARGVKIFRVDNPHTKPLWFWEWLIAKVHRRHPEVVFLAEAFTRPAMMHALGRAGFQQSYSYFTWRNTREELAEYLHEVTAVTPAYYRPNFFVNTPDILTEFLQFGGPAGFKIRAVLAALSNPMWGVYAGFELFEHVARPGAEEYADNEKYEFRPRDFEGAQDRGESLAPFITRLNAIRRAHPALQDLQNLTLHTADNEEILVFSKSRRHQPEGQRTAPADVGPSGAVFPGVPDAEALAASLPGLADTLIVVVNCDPHAAREATVSIDTQALDLRPQDLDAEGRFEVEDLITGARWRWGEQNYVRLDPFMEPAHVLRIVRED